MLHIPISNTDTTVFHLNATEAEIIRRRRAQIAEDELRRTLRDSPRALAAIDRIMRPLKANKENTMTTDTTVFHLNAAEAAIIRRRRSQIAADELRRILRDQSPRALAALDKVMTRPAVCDDRMFEVLASVLETATKLDWIDVAGEPVLGVRESSM